MNPLQQARERFSMRVDEAFRKTDSETSAIPLIETALQEYETTLREILAGEVVKLRGPQAYRKGDIKVKLLRQDEVLPIIKEKYL